LQCDAARCGSKDPKGQAAFAPHAERSAQCSSSSEQAPGAALKLNQGLLPDLTVGKILRDH